MTSDPTPEESDFFKEFVTRAINGENFSDLAEWVESDKRAAVAAERERAASINPQQIDCPNPRCDTKINELCATAKGMPTFCAVRFAAAIRQAPEPD